MHFLNLRDHLVVEFLAVLRLLERQINVFPFIAMIHVVNFEPERPQEISADRETDLASLNTLCSTQDD